MRELESFIGERAIHAQVASLWRTEHFRRSHAEGGWVHEVVQAMCERPVLFCEMTEPSFERSHFYAWMGVVPKRHHYDNPAISDLYYLHEYLHLGQLSYPAGQDHDTWARRIWDNERHASLGSEVYVYFHLPELRTHTFSFEIWADRFLADRAWRERFDTDRLGFEEAFIERREQAMNDPIPGDENERLISTYFGLNVAWAEAWGEKREMVESAMRRFLAEPDPATAVRQHIEWLGGAAQGQVCPFEEQARTFAAVVQGA